MSEAHITTDYLVIGAGFSGLSFVDELFTRTKAHITIVDKRDVPGGHWVDSYPFVKLHQPASFYGVESTELVKYQLDDRGPNKGYGSLASKPEITSYCQTLMRDRLLPSGRVTYLPSTVYEADGRLRGVLSGKYTTVEIRKRLVDATWYTNTIPLEHTRKFGVNALVSCIPPNDLPRLADRFSKYTILGAGKTAIDAGMWLLLNGVNPDRVRWIIPADYWYVNRAKTQTGREFFNEVFEAFIGLRSAMGEATNPLDLALRIEKTGFWHRLDPAVDPRQYHSATVSPEEMDEMRRIRDVVRLGHVTRIEPDQLVLTKGAVPATPDTLYIDCTASALTPRPLVPVFQPGKIIIQLIRYPQIPFSGALIAFLESLDEMDDEKRNSFTAPVPFYKTLDDYVLGLAPDLANRSHAVAHPKVAAWVRSSRLDGFSRLAASVKPHETDKVALLKSLGAAQAAAAKNFPRLLASAQQPKASL